MHLYCFWLEVFLYMMLLIFIAVIILYVVRCTNIIIIMVHIIFLIFYHSKVFVRTECKYRKLKIQQ